MLRRFFLSCLVGLLPFVLTGCHFDILDPKGMVAAQEKYYLIVSVLLMLIVVIPVIIMAIWFAYRYRESNTKATYDPSFTHSTKLEIVWWGIPCIIIAILATITWISSHKLDPYRALDVPGKPLRIQAIALQWRWLFIYPDQHIATINYVQIPVNVPVDFYITSSGPMNSFQVPQLGGQIYAMGGMRTQMHLIANEPGVFRGVSANYTGYGFANMKFSVRAGSQAEFDQWVKTTQKSSKQPLNMESYKQLVQPSFDGAVQYFRLTDTTLFDNIIMEEMMPMPEPGTTGSKKASIREM